VLESITRSVSLIKYLNIVDNKASDRWR